MTLLELAERCEAATGKEDIAWFDDLARAIHEIDPHSNVNGTCKDYPRSVDAALTLVPEGWDYTIEPDGCWLRTLDNRDPSGVAEVQAVLVGRGGKCTALAICAAALRARAAQ